MTPSKALQRYLERHIEADLPAPPSTGAHWDQVLVIPAYNESPALLEKLAQWQTGTTSALVILVLNRPASCTNPHSNKAMREALAQHAHTAGPQSSIASLNATVGLYLYDMETISGLSPEQEGVGLARKTGADIALHWQQLGYIRSPWIHCGDADAEFPDDYLRHCHAAPPGSAAITYPFSHSSLADNRETMATQLYELRLHHYVLGLEYAGSPYAYHTLGSCLAVHREHYASVRGFPKRSGGEDFYLLNKLAKTGTIYRPGGATINLESRVSQRVPFGTGPAVGNILEAGALGEQPLFYHPQCFQALKAWLQVMPALQHIDTGGLADKLIDAGLENTLAAACHRSLVSLGVDKALDHCRRQSTSPAQFSRQFHQWFDGFRTLKLIHSLRDAGWHNVALSQLSASPPNLWPGQQGHSEINVLQQSCYQHWDWVAHERCTENPLKITAPK